MKVFRLLVLGWMLLWLASSGVLAAAMPLCKHTLGHHDKNTAVGHTHAHPTVEGAASGHQDHQHQASKTGNDKGTLAGLIGFVCDSCDLCNLASSIVPAPSLVHSLVLQNLAPRVADVAVPSRFLEQPQPVPLAQRA